MVTCILAFVYRRKVVISAVAQIMGEMSTLLSLRELNLEACAQLVIPELFGTADNRTLVACSRPARAVFSY